MNDEMKKDLTYFLRTQIAEVEKDLERAKETLAAREYSLEMAQALCAEARDECEKLTAQLNAAKYALEKSAAAK